MSLTGDTAYNMTILSHSNARTPVLWFTADHHFDHANILRYCQRPFADVESMNEALIQNWNRVVAPGDTVYHLGDLFLTPPTEAKRLRERLNGSICLIRGNHDRAVGGMKGAFQWVKDYYELAVEDAEVAGGKQHIVLFHYALRVWNRAHYGAWNLYGHSHGTLLDVPGSLSLDVGVDCHEFTPLCYNQVKAIMQLRRTERILAVPKPLSEDNK